MNNFKTFFIFLPLVLCIQVTNAQYINANPDPEGEVWIVGAIPEYTQEYIDKLNAIPELQLSSISAQTLLSHKVDNSQNKFFRPIFRQVGSSCAPAAGIGYTFTYEISRLRNIGFFFPNDSSNWYPSHFAYNFNNYGKDGGSTLLGCWDAIIDQGCPKVPAWGGMAVDSIIWMTGYGKYDSALYNRPDSCSQLIIDDTLALNTLKHWLNDHNEGDSIGGLANFVVKYHLNIDWDRLPDTSDDAGYRIITSFDTVANSGHVLTIVGYNDSIMYDFNGDSLFTNDVDTNGDDTLDLKDWEIGGVIVTNTWGLSWMDTGFVYVPYRLLATPEPVGIEDRRIYFLHIDSATACYEPEIVLKLEIEHPVRNTLSYHIGHSSNTTIAEPDTLIENRSFGNHNGGTLPMQGVNEDPIEIILDYSHYFEEDGNIFLKICERTTLGFEGAIHKYSLLDHRWGEDFELDYDSVPKYFGSGRDTITMKIEYDLLPFTMDSTISFPGNMICRRECTVIDSNQADFDKGARLDFYDGTLTIEEDAELIIEDSVTITAKRDADSLIVYGDLQIGRGVSFVAEDGASLVIDIRNSELELRIAKANFENVELIAQIDSLCIDSCTFTDSHIEFQRTTNQKFVISNSIFEESLVNATIGEMASSGYGTVIINDCSFENTKNTSNQSVIHIGSYKNFVILRDSLIFNEGTGINLYNSGSSTSQNNYIKNCYLQNNNTQSPDSSVGIVVYNSYADIELNHIEGHNYGIASFDRSNVRLLGSDTAGSPNNTQHIFDNLVDQVYATTGSFPFEFEYNSVYNDQTGDTTLVYYNSPFLQTPPPLDVRNNDWGEDDLDTNLLHPPGQYLWNPEWVPGGHKSMPVDKDLFYQAVQYIKNDSYAEAESNFKEIIEDFPDSKYVQASVKELLALTRVHDQDFSGLQSYLDSIPSLWEDSVTANITEHVINWCNIDKEEYATAIAWFESQIENPVSYADSICAIIDLAYTYTLFDTSALKSIVINSKFPQYRPLSKADFNQKRKYHTGLLFKKYSLKPKPDPEDTITDIQDQLKAFPNPFTNSITFQYHLADDSFVKLIIYNGLGEQVFIIADEQQQAGQQSATFYSNDLSPGIYYCSLEVNGSVYATEKIICLKP